MKNDVRGKPSFGRPYTRHALANAAIYIAFFMPGMADAGIAFTSLTVGQLYQQAATGISFVDDQLSLTLNATGANDFDGVTVLVPGQSTPKSLIVNPFLDFTGTYRTASLVTPFVDAGATASGELAKVNAAFPFGTYSFTATNSTTHQSKSASLLYDNNHFPTVSDASTVTAVPALTAASYVTLQGLDVRRAQTLNFNSFSADGRTPAANGSLDPVTRIRIFNATTGQAVYTSPDLPSGTTSYQLPANTLKSNTTYTYRLEFINDVFCGANTACDSSASIGYVKEFDTLTAVTFTTSAAVGTPPVTVNLQGGTIEDPVKLPDVVGRIGEVDGMIGGYGSKDFYEFFWFGGDFAASAQVTGVSGDASYEFELLDLFGHVLAEITLDAANNFSADLLQLGLAGGRDYEIGLLTNALIDPPFSIRFATPVGGAVPEPASWILCALGLTSLGFTCRRGNRRRSLHRSLAYA